MCLAHPLATEERLVPPPCTCFYALWMSIPKFGRASLNLDAKPQPEYLALAGAPTGSRAEDPTLGHEPSPGPGRDVPNRPPPRASPRAPLRSLQHHFPHPPVPYGNSPSPHACPADSDACPADSDAAAHRGAQHPPEHPKTAPLAGARTFSWCDAGCSTNTLGDPGRG